MDLFGNDIQQIKKVEDNYLFFDTETTGLPRSWSAPVTDLNNWPRLVQLAWLLSDNTGKELTSGSCIVRPEGFTIPVEVSKIHGITTERAEAEGVPLETALAEFNKLINRSTHIIAHNISYDEKIIGAEFIRKNVKNAFAEKKLICTKEKGTNFCAIPGGSGFKWPKLAELYIKLFGTGFDGAHNAVADVTATARCFWEMRKRGIL